MHSQDPYKLPSSQLQADSTVWIANRPAASQPNGLVGQDRALNAIARAQTICGPYAHVFAITPGGLDIEDVFSAAEQRQKWPTHELFDWMYLINPDNISQPICMRLPAGSAHSVHESLQSLTDTPTTEREPILKRLQAQFNWSPLHNYIKQIKTLAFTKGETISTIIVSQSDKRNWYYCPRLTEIDLFGQVHTQTKAGTANVDLSLLQCGALLKANGGTLVVNAEELIKKPEHWIRLKYILMRGEFVWTQPTKAPYYAPQPVPIKLKVILAGSRSLLAHLRELDTDFANLFPYLADFTDHYAPHGPSQAGIADYYAYLAYLQQRIQHRPLSDDGIQKLLTVSSSFTEHQSELSLDTIRIQQLLEEANSLATQDGSQAITKQHINQALKEAKLREQYLAELSQQGMLENQVKIDTAGEVVGQINGLTVVTMGGSEFGEPSRITATVHYGDGDIIDIERKSELSGSIHTKGVMILMAYLANLFAGKDPMPLSATLVFEQSYHEVDGDSASLAELCCLISALADVPVTQSLAVTGAIDQFGNVQAIGGVNEKIEGFYRLAKRRGFSVNQGVIIPRSNQLNLHLSDEIVESVRQGEFSVYQVEHVSEAFDLLMGMPCGDSSSLASDTLFGRINRRIGQAQHQDERKPWWKI